MARPLRRGSFALAVSLATAAVVLAGCHRWPFGKAADGGTDAGGGADASAAAFDANLPETVVIVLDAGIESNGQPRRPQEDDVPMMALPRPCTDKALGTVTFVQDGAKVKIASSKGIASGTCVRMDEHKLLCDWVDKDGNATVSRRALSYGPKTKIAGSYDAKHGFSCPAQSDAVPPPPPKPPHKKGVAPSRR